MSWWCSGAFRLLNPVWAIRSSSASHLSKFSQMPKPKGKRGRGGGNSGNRGGTDDSNRYAPIEKDNMHNARFELYYKAQNILPSEEWDHFMDKLRQPLPTTFRVAGSRQVARALNDVIKSTYIPLLRDTAFEGVPIPPPHQIPWYPDELAWQFNVEKKVLRKNSEFKKFHSFLVWETEIGNISRQEAVSMLPPLFLQVEPHHRVIDMCAAPGSKTAQLLEALHANDTVNVSSIPTGLLIANDTDAKRTHLLIHQSARLPSPAFMVTNSDASCYPVIKIPTEAKQAEKRHRALLFDRILCDVPCSGDGTVRKNLAIWKNWSPLDGNGLHPLQLRILQRAMQMLRKGGRIVYSTCSLNPIENEAVVAAALNSVPGFALIDASSSYPELIRKPGLTTWKPAVDKAVNFYDSFDSYTESTVDERQKQPNKTLASFWPPSNAEELNLTRCMRIYPHHQDTGGFFVAILEKVKYPSTTEQKSRDGKRPADSIEDPVGTKKPRLMTDAEESGETSQVTENLQQELMDEDEDEDGEILQPSNRSRGREKQTDGGGGGSFKEPPFTYLPTDDPALVACLEKLNIDTSFPLHNVMVRNPAGEPARSLYLTNDIVKQVIECNEYTRIRLMTSGTKLFGRQEVKGPEMSFRILDEGLPVVLPFVPPQFILTGDIVSLRTLMQGYYPLLTSFPEEFRSAVEGKPNGSHIVRFPAGNREGVTLSHDLLVPVWRSNVSLGLMVDKKTKSALSQRLFGEDITSVGREAAATQQKKVEATQASTIEAALTEVETPTVD